MKLQDVISKAYEVDWSLTNSFLVRFFQPASVHQGKFQPFLDRDVNMFITQVDLPDVQGIALENWVMDRYRLGVYNDQQHRLTVGFLDYNNLELWTSFMDQYRDTVDGWFDDQKMDISIFKESDIDPDMDPLHIITYKDSIIESVGRVQFSNEQEQQIQRFNVTFKSQKFTLRED